MRHRNARTLVHLRSKREIDAGHANGDVTHALPMMSALMGRMKLA
jgi:hypothetical protein